MLFRFIVIKYADRGMVQTGGLSSGLFNKLYIIFTASSSIYTYLSLLVRLWISDEERFHVIRSWLINEEYFHVVRPLYVKFKPNFYIFCLCTFIISIIFCNVQYIKKHKIGLKKKIQRNVMTFNVNFYFFILFMFLSLLQYLLKSLVETEQSGFVESFIIFVHFIRVFFVGFIRPVIIIFLLKKNMPDFFEDHEENQQAYQTFYLSGHSYEPRQQKFSHYKPFRQNARWGWQKEKLRAREENAAKLNVLYKSFQTSVNSMPDIDI